MLVDNRPSELTTSPRFTMPGEMQEGERVYLNKSTPMVSARLFLQSHRTPAAENTLLYWVGSHYQWRRASYWLLEDEALRKMLYRWLDDKWTWAKRGDGLEEELFSATRNKVSDIVDAIRAETYVSHLVRVPTWLDGRDDDAHSYLPCGNVIVHLPSFVAQLPDPFTPPTPQFFTTAALDYDFAEDAPEPAAWLAFLREIWGDDEESIRCLQEWFGYCLTPDTRLQKMLLLIGPKRSGKGTIGRILSAMLGAHNVAGPTLCSLATNFGLWPLVGKSLAIISDARLSGRSDAAVIVERLLSISGEDSLTIDRKNLSPVTVKLSTRLMVCTNELPKLSDSSGALAGRFIILRMTKSFFGREDAALTEKLLAELPGILLWAVEGWRRLQERGRFVMPTSSAEAVQELDELGSPISAFIRESCTVGPGQTVAVDELFKAWQDWCTAQGRDNAGTKQSFGRDLTAVCPGLAIRQPRTGSARFRVYEGIALGKPYAGEL